MRIEAWELNEKISNLTEKRARLVENVNEKVDEKLVLEEEKNESIFRRELKKRKKLTKECLKQWAEILEKKVDDVA